MRKASDNLFMKYKLNLNTAHSRVFQPINTTYNQQIPLSLSVSVFCDVYQANDCLMTAQCWDNHHRPLVTFQPKFIITDSDKARPLQPVHPNSENNNFKSVLSGSWLWTQSQINRGSVKIYCTLLRVYLFCTSETFLHSLKTATNAPSAATKSIEH